MLIPNNLFSYCRLSVCVCVCLKINFRIFINTFSMILSSASDSNTIYDELSDFVKIRTNHNFFPSNVLKIDTSEVTCFL